MESLLLEILLTLFQILKLKLFCSIHAESKPHFTFPTVYLNGGLVVKASDAQIIQVLCSATSDGSLS